jgi:hypothetical protein
LEVDGCVLQVMISQPDPFRRKKVKGVWKIAYIDVVFGQKFRGILHF